MKKRKGFWVKNLKEYVQEESLGKECLGEKYMGVSARRIIVAKYTGEKYVQ